MSENVWAEIPGAILPSTDNGPELDFDWLDGIDKDDCYMTLKPDTPAKSLDFGKDGYTGSVTTWHELLQFTTPDDECGVVFVRGDFPDSAESFLARAQRRNQKGTFGLQLHVRDDYKYALQKSSAHGMINLRWPCTRLDFVRPNPPFDSVIFASYTACSFVKDHTLYQVARIPPSNPPNSVPSDSNLTTLKPDTHAVQTDITIAIGGTFRVGCSNTNVRSANARSAGDLPAPFCDIYEEMAPTVSPAYMLAATSRYHERRLEIRLWIDRQPIPLETVGRNEARLNRVDSHDIGIYHSDVFDLYATEIRRLFEDTATTMVASFSFVKSDTIPDFGALPMISPTDVQQYLGISDESEHAPYRIWAGALNQLHGPDSFELNTVGRGVEQILGVASVPLHQRDHPFQESNLPKPSGACSSTNKSSVGHRHNKPSELPNQSPTSHPTENFHTFAGSQPTVGTDMGIALIRNIVTPQLVDISSCFWQLRLLVKAIVYLDAHPNLAAQPERPAVRRKHYCKLREAYRNMLVRQVRGICRWVLNAIPEIGPRNRPNSPIGILPSQVTAGSKTRICRPAELDNPQWTLRQERASSTISAMEKGLKGHRWYCALIIWYAMANLEETFSDQNLKSLLWETMPTFLSMRNTQSNGSAAALHISSLCFIRWYHSHCVVQLLKCLERDDPERFEALSVDFKQHQKWANDWQVNSEKSLRLFGQGRLIHHSLDYEVANLVFIANEIALDNEGLIQPTRSSISYAKLLMKNRKDTVILNPGSSTLVRWDPVHNMRSATPQPAPWELDCLGHHAGVWTTDCAAATNEYMKACGDFVLSDYTFMATCDQSRADSVGEWWDIATTSIICATILDRFERSDQPWPFSVENEVGELGRKDPSARSNSLDMYEQSSGPQEAAATDPIRWYQTPKTAPIEQIPKGVEKDIKKILEILKEKTKPSEEREGFVWRKRMPQLLYHADTSVQSLEDTPGVFRLKQNRNVGIRNNVKKYLKDNYMPDPDWTLEGIAATIPAEKLLTISCIDLALKVDGAGTPEIGIVTRRGRIDKSFWNAALEEQPSVLKLIDESEDRGLWLLYFLGKHEEHPNFAKLSDDLKKEMQKDSKVRTELLEAYQQSLLLTLNDSLVDLGTKYRILFVERLSPIILQAMIYMWHPDALDTFDDHYGVLSHFFDIHNQSSNGSGDIWITSITISHWRLQDKNGSFITQTQDDIEENEKVARSDGKDDSSLKRHWLLRMRANKKKKSVSARSMAAFPPQNISDERLRRYNKEIGKRQLSSIRELSMSLVITGDRQGRCWTCSIVSELIDEKAVAGYALAIRDILQMFIHQQYTGRVLCFLLLLGYLCESFSKECEDFAGELDNIMGMDPMVLLKGIEWQKSDDAVKKLKEMLWGLEALRVFDDKLKRALEEIKECKQKMEKELERGSDIRHKDMKRQVEKIQEEFNKRRDRLENAHISIMQRVAQSNRLLEGTSSVLSVEQNENISMLTWMTILYLPLAFIAGVFSMGHGIVPDRSGWGTFLWLIGTFLGATILFAISLQFIIGKLRRMGGVISGGINLASQAVIQSIETKPQYTTGTGVEGVGSRRRRGWSQSSRSPPRDEEEAVESPTNNTRSIEMTEYPEEGMKGTSRRTR